ncbi:serpin family protein [Pseudoteredinibacter isoporae]|uniref:serpin family protein n=1 Tax=Pseudoteredinibacter isoporae TaxID=570281 RepID=UPI00310A809E
MKSLVKYSLLAGAIFSSGTAIASGATAAISPVDLQSQTTVNQMSSDMLLARQQGKLSRNTMISSVSLYYALSILERGADRTTKTLMTSLLLANDGLKVPEVAPQLANAIMEPSHPERPTLGHFLLANAIWSSNGASNGKPFTFSESFVADSMQYYSATKQSLDFMAEGASSYFNDWAAENTNGLIHEILSDSDVKSFQWVITNAAYFEGSWGVATRRQPPNQRYQFKSLDGSTFSTDTIATRGYRNSVLDNEDGSLAFSIPFAGRKYSFIVYMPSAEEADIQGWLLRSGISDMPNVINTLNDRTLPLYELSIELPVFTFEDELEMREGSFVARELGLSPLFSDKVDLTRMVDRQNTALAVQDTKVGLIKQNTKIELDEKGVKAAAVTVISGIQKTSAGRKFPKRRIVVDRPFVFSIVENTTRTLLFNGVLIKPDH